MSGSDDGFKRRRNHRRLVLSILLFMILLNLVVRYPLVQSVPHGSDTFPNLDLARSLTQDGRARWTLSPLSYFGLFPFSYPSGAPFVHAEFNLLSEANWNAVPWVFSVFFSILLLLGGFLLLRAFHIRDELAAVLAGMMALSPFFMYFSIGQASSRGFLIPIFVLGLFVVFWQNGGRWPKMILFCMLGFGALTIHRSSFVVILIEAIAGAVVFISPSFPKLSSRRRFAAYTSCIVLALALFVWPYIPGLNKVFGAIPEISSTYRMAEIEFKTGFLLEGDSLVFLIANLWTNYVGSIGLVLLLIPLSMAALYPESRGTRKTDVFMIVMVIVFAPYVWKAQYVQLILLPFAYILAGTAIQRYPRIKGLLSRSYASVRRKEQMPVMGRISRTATIVFSLFLLVSTAFSMVMYEHRATLADPFTDEANWPSGSIVNVANYIGSDGYGDWEQFLSNSGMVDRRIGWFSEWDCPLVDPTQLQASGYLNVNRSDLVFELESDVDFFTYLTSFYKAQTYYWIDPDIENRELYDLCWDNFGILRIYYQDPSTAMLTPKVNLSTARISMVVVLNQMGSQIMNPFTAQDTFTSEFLVEVTSKTYKIYDSDNYCIHLAAAPYYG